MKIGLIKNQKVKILLNLDKEKVLEIENKINIQKIIEENRHIRNKSNRKLRTNKTLFERNSNFKKNISTLQSIMPETKKFQNTERYSKYLSSMRKSYNNFVNEKIDFIPRPIKEETEPERFSIL